MILAGVLSKLLEVIGKANLQTTRYTFCGTVEYMPPEILLGDVQGFAVDVWALGVLLYELVYKKTPFAGRTPHQILTKIQTEKPKFDKSISNEARDLIERILILDPNERITIREIKEHPFFKKYEGSISTMASVPKKKEKPNGRQKKIKENPEDVFKRKRY